MMTYSCRGMHDFRSSGHHHFGAVAEVDTSAFGQYTFTLADGRWVTIEAEEDLGRQLTVVLTDLVRTDGPG
jgi:hypothetical protein